MMYECRLQTDVCCLHIEPNRALCLIVLTTCNSMFVVLGLFLILSAHCFPQGINVQDILKLKANAIYTISGVSMTTRRQMLKIKVRDK